MMQSNRTNVFPEEQTVFSVCAEILRAAAENERNAEWLITRAMDVARDPERWNLTLAECGPVVTGYTALAGYLRQEAHAMRQKADAMRKQQH